MADALFYVMAVAAVLAALGVVLAKNPMQCVLSLLGSFFALSVISRGVELHVHVPPAPEPARAHRAASRWRQRQLASGCRAPQ